MARKQTVTEPQPQPPTLTLDGPAAEPQAEEPAVSAESPNPVAVPAGTPPKPAPAPVLCGRCDTAMNPVQAGWYECPQCGHRKRPLDALGTFLRRRLVAGDRAAR